MGEQLQKVSVKWGPSTLAHEAELLSAFSGLVEGRSQLSRVTMKIAWRLVRTVGILRVIEELVQDKPCETESALVAQSTTEFPAIAAPGAGQSKKPPVRADFPANGNPNGSHGRRRFALKRQAVLEMDRALVSPFLLHSTPRTGWVS